MLNETFIPVQLQTGEHPKAVEQFNVNWTPTQVILDSNGRERYRIEGFLPTEDFLGQVGLGLARMAFENRDFSAAEKQFNAVCLEYARAGVAPEACYWAGVSAYKATNNAERLRDTQRLLAERYPESEWARKASVWK